MEQATKTKQATTSEPTIDQLAQRVEHLLTTARQRYRRLWAYYRNPMRFVGAPCGGDGALNDRPYRQAQEWGLPSRITGTRSGCEVNSATPIDQVARKEVVIENDIGWRVETMIDYLFGKPIVIDSAAPAPDRRAIISELLRLILAHNGGILFLQQLALLGSVYGFVDVLVKLDCDAPPLPGACAPRDLGHPPACDPETSNDEPASPAPASDGASDVTPAASTSPSHAAPLARLAGMVRLEVVEPARALPFLSGDDYRVVDAYAQCTVTTNAACDAQPTMPRRTWTDRFRRMFSQLAAVRSTAGSHLPDAVTIDLLTPTTWSRYENGKLLAHGENSLGLLPLVHIQNTAVPFEYSGASDVEPLIPLQDELNTRLCDRAHRLTMQSFRMYLGKPRHGSDVGVHSGREHRCGGRFQRRSSRAGRSDRFARLLHALLRLFAAAVPRPSRLQAPWRPHKTLRRDLHIPPRHQ
jgi:hypothetical protein